MLAHVVTIREINPFAQTGIMKLDDLKHIFKASSIGCIDARSYIVNLLNKFEVALTWDSRTLLIPSLLPTEEDVHRAQMYGLTSLVKVKVPLRTRCREGRNRNIAISPKSVLYKDCEGRFQMSFPSVGNQSGKSFFLLRVSRIHICLRCKSTSSISSGRCTIRKTDYPSPADVVFPFWVLVSFDFAIVGRRHHR